MLKLLSFLHSPVGILPQYRKEERNKNQLLTDLCCGVQIRAMFCAEVMGM